VKSWTVNEWLDAAEQVHPHRWQNIDHIHLQQLFRKRLDNLPSALSRGEIFSVAQGANADPLTAFLWTMAWDHNGTNYGASRVNRIVADPNAAAKIAQIVGLAQAGSIQAAFEELHRQYRLPGLGTSFGSKLIYFAGFDPGVDSTQPLVLDSLVVQALAEVIDPSLAQASWNYQTRNWAEYWFYCDLVRMIRNRYVPKARIDMVEHWLWLLGGRWCWHHDAIRRYGVCPIP
jgi:hypothetical protein